MFREALISELPEKEKRFAAGQPLTEKEGESLLRRGRGGTTRKTFPEKSSKAYKGRRAPEVWEKYHIIHFFVRGESARSATS